jgi:Glycosyl hydrolase family 76
VLVAAAALAACALLAPSAGAAPSSASAATTHGDPASSYPRDLSRPVIPKGPARAASSAGGTSAPGSSSGSSGSSSSSSKKTHKKPKKPAIHGNPLRAQLAFAAMQRYYYIPGSGLYQGEPFSALWPFSQALAATIDMSNIPGMKGAYAHELHVRLVGLNNYLDTNNSGQPEGTFTSDLAAFDATVAPPAGPGGTKYYDDNDWVGIELARVYELTHSPTALGSAEAIMAFEMASWQVGPEVACPGGIPFSNAAENTDRNTITTAPAAELALQLFHITHNAQYLQFAQMAYEWVRSCLLQPSGLYADHIRQNGAVEPMLWSYTQGAMIGAGTLLYKATGDPEYLFQARQTAGAALSYFTPARLVSENPFFPLVYFRNVMYLDSVTHDPPGPAIAQNYVNYAWAHLRLSGDLFVSGSPASAQLLYQAAIVQLYALLSSSPQTFF